MIRKIAALKIEPGGKIADFQPIFEKHYRDLAEVRSLAPRGVLGKINEMLKFESMVDHLTECLEDEEYWHIRTENYLS
ncbi:hypothetical protein DFJ73DRAFT_801804 [Zopfochytrium polystomum]|nr:hypothetical protein DFJ73DRAFT_801804 [Zopfochytrium polystomum]